MVQSYFFFRSPLVPVDLRFDKFITRTIYFPLTGIYPYICLMSTTSFTSMSFRSVWNQFSYYYCYYNFVFCFFTFQQMDFFSSDFPMMHTQPAQALKRIEEQKKIIFIVKIRMLLDVLPA